jgi:hypothetical protein
MKTRTRKKQRKSTGDSQNDSDECNITLLLFTNALCLFKPFDQSHYFDTVGKKIQNLHSKIKKSENSDFEVKNREDVEANKEDDWFFEEESQRSANASKKKRSSSNSKKPKKDGDEEQAVVRKTSETREERAQRRAEIKRVERERLKQLRQQQALAKKVAVFPHCI